MGPHEGTAYLVSELLEGERLEARLDAIDVRTGNSRQVAEYADELVFGTPFTYANAGSLSRDGRSFATSVLNRRSDLWILEGFPKPRRPWF